MVEKVKVGVIGVGRMGTHHLRKYLELDSLAEVVGLHDADPARAAAVSAELGVKAFSSLPELLFECDAVSIASATQAHFAIARQALDAGVDILVEKPLCDDVDNAETLIRLARANQRILQVGFVERFRLRHLLKGLDPGAVRYIETHRLSPVLNRETQVDVISDLMIHDLDLVLSLVGEEPEYVSAIAIPVVTSRYDLANVRLEFPSGAVADLNTSRVSPKTERRLRMFATRAYFSVDFLQNDLGVHVHTAQGIDRHIEKQPELDALRMQCADFLENVRSRRLPQTNGEAGVAALRVLKRIHHAVKAREQKSHTMVKERISDAPNITN